MAHAHDKGRRIIERAAIKQLVEVVARGHDGWFRAQVQKTLDGIREGRVGVIPAEQHDARWRRRRAGLCARGRRKKVAP